MGKVIGAATQQPLNKKKEKMPSVQKSIDELVNGMNKVLDKVRINENIKKALAIDADISYKNLEDGKTEVTVVKDGKTNTETFDSISDEIKTAIDKAMSLRRKKISKNEAKEAVKIRYKIGDIVVLRGKIKDGSQRLIKKFEVKKVIWSIKGKAMNILVLKQLEGVNNNRTLDKNDCKKYHIKYEEGLQVYSMMLNFSRLKKK